jgi:hypothetical protein
MVCNLSPAEMEAARVAYHQRVDPIRAVNNVLDQEAAERRAFNAEKYKLGTCRKTQTEHICHTCNTKIPKGSQNIRTRPAMLTNPRTLRPRIESVYFCKGCKP